MPTVLIDADGCPVVDLTIRICRACSVPVLILCDTAHRIERDGAETMVFDKGADSVDVALVNHVRPGDVVITQDYGLAAMVLVPPCACPQSERSGIHGGQHRRVARTASSQ